MCMCVCVYVCVVVREAMGKGRINYFITINDGHPTAC